MDAIASPSFLARVEMAPRDPILGITETYLADQNPRKVNLGVGVYYDDKGKVPLLECVRRAEAQLMEKAGPRSYLPIDGIPTYNSAVQALLFGDEAVAAASIITIQALGGTGSLKLGADFLKRVVADATVWISDPSWENHRALFESAGFPVKTYPYYDSATQGLKFAEMKAALSGLAEGSIVLLHACCHNPTGVDLSAAQWADVVEIVASRNLIPFLDIAYQGFGESINADGAIVRRFADTGGPLFVASSFSKSFSLYGERVGALSIRTASSNEAQRVLSQIKRVVRTNYSNPPTHGGHVVAAVLTSPELRGLWERELAAMRDRIRAMRQQLVDRLKTRAPNRNFDFVLTQRGIFSYSGLTKDEVARLRNEYSIYPVDSGRICVAALNSQNVDYVAEGIATVIG
ncbi:MAG: aromatic amino acid transaminase [Burkholderiales bacterium]|nr:aspartate/tyrosine/aromatic aminotransferase [Burkholderiales bacterium]MDQ3195755.1 aspartate/tyrosine/aromatic aminotransferase [Pseudomonadota bacterium]